MAAANFLTARTKWRQGHHTKSPTLVHLDRVSMCNPHGEKVLSDLSLRIRGGERWKVLCDDKRVGSSLLKCVAGLLTPTSGLVTIVGHVSWPLGHASGLSNKLSSAENSRFLSGIYGQPGQRDQDIDLIRRLCGFSTSRWNEPLNKISGACNQRLRLALSLAFDFDLYVVDPSAFRTLHRQGDWNEHWQTMLQQRLQERAVITIGSDDLGVANSCRKGLVLEKGQVIAKGSLERCRALLAERQQADV
jgi:capsular polysaccharide transport system ATP-binding protein